LLPYTPSSSIAGRWYFDYTVISDYDTETLITENAHESRTLNQQLFSNATDL